MVIRNEYSWQLADFQLAGRFVLDHVGYLAIGVEHPTSSEVNSPLPTAN